MLRFTATECGSKTEYGTLVCGASNAKAKDAQWHSFIFMRATRDGDPDDDGPYFELDDQAWGDHNWVRAVRFDGNQVTITLSPARGRGIGHRVIQAELRCPPAHVARFKRAVRSVFRDQPERVQGE